MAVPDEYLAFNGTTVLGQIDNLKREEVERERERERVRMRKETAVKTMTKSSYDKKGQGMSGKQYKMVPMSHHPWNGSQSVPVSRAASPPPTSSGSTVLPNIPLGKGGWGESKGGWGEKKGRLGKRKSFFNIFGGGGRREGVGL